MPTVEMERLTIDLGNSSDQAPDAFVLFASEVAGFFGTDQLAYLPGPIVRPLRAEDYPVLAKLWDNDDDAIYDTL